MLAYFAGVLVTINYVRQTRLWKGICEKNVITHKPALHICINQVIEVNVCFSLNDCIFFFISYAKLFLFQCIHFLEKADLPSHIFHLNMMLFLLSPLAGAAQPTIPHWFKYCFPWKWKVGVPCLLWKILVTQQCLTVHKRKSLHRYVQNRTFKSFNRRRILLIEFL